MASAASPTTPETRRVLITRPEEDARSFADALSAQGIGSLVEPMMTVEILPGPALELQDVQALLATSANGARALAARTEVREVPVLAVGDATASIALGLGFQSVESAGGDVKDLCDLVVRRCQPRSGALVHAAAAIVAGDLGGSLSALGFEYRREVLYATRPVATLSTAVCSALSQGKICGVTLFSPRTARLFVERIDAAGLGDYLVGVDAFCLSPAVADAARAIAWNRICTAESPNGRGLARAVFDAYGDT